MVDVVGKVHRPRIGEAARVPLAERYERARAEAMRTIKPTDPEYGVINSMVSESSIDLMMDAIAAATKRHAPAPQSPELRAAIDRLLDLRRKERANSLKIIDCQKKAARVAQSRLHQILGDIDIDSLFGRPAVVVDIAADIDTFRDVSAAAEAEARVFKHLQSLERKLAKLNEAIGFDFDDLPTQNRTLIRKLAERIEALEANQRKPKGDPA